MSTTSNDAKLRPGARKSGSVTSGRAVIQPAGSNVRSGAEQTGYSDSGFIPAAVQSDTESTGAGLWILLVAAGVGGYLLFGRKPTNRR